MSIQILKAPAAAADPIEIIEKAAEAMDLDAERIDACEVHIAAPGVWRDSGLWFTWRPELATLQMGAPMDLKTPPDRAADVSRLIALVNERLWIGHFDLWSDDGAIIFRNAMVLPESGALDKSQAERLIRGASEAIDRFYPAFNYLLWGGKSPQDALDASLFETAGNA